MRAISQEELLRLSGAAAVGYVALRCDGRRRHSERGRSSSGRFGLELGWAGLASQISFGLCLAHSWHHLGVLRWDTAGVLDWYVAARQSSLRVLVARVRHMVKAT